jgi:uncharacterized YccA/Bax inhibitor family protein
MQSRNPVLSRNSRGYATFHQPPVAEPEAVSAADLQELYERPAFTGTRTMTVDDVVMRTAILLGVVFVAGAAAWIAKPGPAVVVGALIAGFVLAMAATFKKVPSRGLVIAYAACEGVFLGAVSHVFELMYPGIVVQAVLGTGLAFVGMLWAYRNGIVRVTPRMRRMVLAAGLGVLALALVNLVASIFVSGGLGLRDGGALAILFSLVAIGVAVFFLALDFDIIERQVAMGVPEAESWRAAFGLVVTLVWLYLEILRLLSYLRD